MPDQNSASVTTSSLLFMQTAWRKADSSKSAQTQMCKVHFREPTTAR